MLIRCCCLTIVHVAESGDLMLKRKAYDRLLEWKARPGHKPLLLRGQRNVGKTTVLREFAKTYPNSAYVDLSADRRIREDFGRSTDVDKILESLSVRDASFEPVPGETLIVLDEVQSCPPARSSLKRFCEDGRFDVVASDSLPDAPLRGDLAGDRATDLIPVGYEEHMRMYGMDFEEFLWAKGYSDRVIGMIRGHIRDRTPMTESLLHSTTESFAEFMMVGGMPEVVSAYAGGAGLPQVMRVLDGIAGSVRDDVYRYAPEPECPRIMRAIESIPHQLSEPNKRFTYSRIEDDCRSREGLRRYGGSILWIEGSGIGNMCHHLRDVSTPLRISADPDRFKVYMSDTGMLLHMMDDDRRAALNALRNGDISFDQGALAENAVAECFMKAGVPRYYHIDRRSPGRMELDFVVRMGTDVAAVEVRTGRDRTAPSLTNALGDPRFRRHLTFGRSNISVDGDGVEHYPLFAAAFVRDMWEEDDWMSGFGSGSRPPEVRGVRTSLTGRREPVPCRHCYISGDPA